MATAAWNVLATGPPVLADDPDDDNCRPADHSDGGQLVIVVANAGAPDRLAARMAGVIAPLGYKQTLVTTALDRRALSAVLFGPDRGEEALALSAGLGIPIEQVEPFAGSPVATDDVRGDCACWSVMSSSGRLNPVGVG